MSYNHEKKHLKKQDALQNTTDSPSLDAKRVSGSTSFSSDRSTEMKSFPPTVEDTISIISNRSEPSLRNAAFIRSKRYAPDLHEPNKSSLSDVTMHLTRAHGRPPMETTSMLDDSTQKPTPKKNTSLMNKFRALGRMATYTKAKAETVDIGDAYVVQDQEYGPVCFIEDSPNRIFKCAQNGNAKEVARIIKADPSRLHARNNHGQMALHVAAAKNHIEVVEVLLEQHPDIDALDNDGNTPLHLAVYAGADKIVDLLIKNGAKTDIRNIQLMMPIHVAAELPNVDVVKSLLSNGVDPNGTGESGMTALHYAAAMDNGVVMKVLMQRGGKPCWKCDYGYYPIHIAAKCAAASAMEAIIEQAIKQGYTREQILSFKDRENNLPLHAAVNGGDIKAVKVCLSAGASVKAQQEDGSTPLHFACAQGNMEMIRLMEQMQRDNFLAAVSTVDVMKMTPLHRAALFNHTPAIVYLLEHGADIDSRDNNERTPLLLSASKGCWTTVQVLLEKGADVHVRDIKNRNFLHLAVKFGGKLEQIGGALIMDFRNLQNEKDDFGCTPLHYASKEGHLLALDDLIKMGAQLNLKDNQKQSPFHFAARYGRYNTCRRLLDSLHGPNIINETDGSGLTALHIAAQNGHTKVIQLLLQRGAVVNKDNEDNTALHHAAAQGWTHSMKVILSVHGNLLNAVNIDGDTALHVAAKNGQASATSLLLSLGAKILKNHNEQAFFDYVIQLKFSDVAIATINHERWEEVLQTCSSIYGCFILGLIEHLPAICLNVLDRCQVASEHDPKSPDYHITYNFKYLDTPTSCLEATKKSNNNGGVVPMMSLNAMVKNNRVDCLSHPVCVTFLQVKWKHYGVWVYTAYLFVYIAFLASLTSFVVNHNSLQHYDPDCTENTTMIYLNGNKKDGYEFNSFYVVCLWFIEVYSVLNLIKEILQLITQRQFYFADIGNALEWSLYTSALIFVTPFFSGKSFHWQWEAGAVCVFLAWFNCLVFLQRFDFFGIYVVMFLEILRTLVQVLCVFSILIIAFGLSFYMLLFREESKAFSTPLLSFLRTFMMMLELDYMASFNDVFVDGRNETLHFGTLTLLLLICFVLLMPILLMNLLIGLAVGDIESVQSNARLKRLAMQVELHINMESKMPLCIHRIAQITEFKQFPNKCQRKLENFFSMMSLKSTDSDLKSPQNGMGSYLYEEMYKQKVRMREMTTTLDKNNQLLRQIMQKMEIHTEDEAWDEGAGLSDDSNDELKSSNKQYKSKSFKEKMYLKTAVVSFWKKGFSQL